MNRRDLLLAAAAAAMGLTGLSVFYRATLASGGDLVPGTLIDSRFLLVVMEHWHRVITFRESPLDVSFFHPLKGILGMSDSMVLFAVPYVPMRLLGIDPFSAFRNALMVVSAAGYAGCVLFLYRTLGLHPLAAIPMSAVFAFSSHLYMTMFHPQMLAIALLPYLAMALWNWQRYAPVFIVLLGLTALTTGAVAWSVGLWLVLAAVTAYGLYASRDGILAPLRAVALQRGLWRLALIAVLCAIPLGAVYWSLAVHRTTSPWPAVRVSLARDYVYFTGSAVVFSCLAGIVWSLIAFYRRQSGAAAIAIVGVSMLIGTALASEYPGAFQPWEYVHRYVPGGGLFRVPFRFVIVLTFGMCVTADFLSNLIKGQDLLPRSAAYIVVAALCANGLRSQIHNSDLRFSVREQLSRLRSVPPPPAECLVFYSNVPSEPFPAAEAQLDAILIGNHFDLPTVNGYTAEKPKGWDLHGGENYLERVRQYVNRNGLTGVCDYDPPTRSWTSLK